MRISFILPYAGLGGGTRIVASHAEWLQGAGHRVAVISQPPADRPLREKLRSWVRGRGWPTVPKDGPSHFDGLGVDHRVLESARPVTAADVPDGDVVVATWWETAEWVAGLPAAKGAKAYFIQGDDRVVYPPMRQEFHGRIVATWRLPMHRIVVSRWVRETIVAETGGEAELVHNGVDAREFHAEPRGRQARPTVGMVYSTASCKGCAVGLEAMARAAGALPDLRLVAFGAQSPTPKLPLPAGCTYECRPAREKLREIYGGCDLWLFPSRREGFGLPILEAMACRTPVIATPAGAAPELIAGGGGMLVPADDAAAMAGRVMEVLRAPEATWRGMSDAAWATAQRFQSGAAAALMEAALRHAVARGAAEAAGTPADSALPLAPAGPA